MERIYRIYQKFSFWLFWLVASATVFLLGLRVLSFSPYMVLSGSMEPKYPVGSLIYVREIAADKLEIGDVITFVLQDSDTVVTHQIIELHSAQSFCVTKGIANEVADQSPVYYKNILGKVYFCIPYMGYLSAKINTAQGKACVYALAVFIGFAYCVECVWRWKKNV